MNSYPPKPFNWRPVLRAFGNNQSAVARACKLSDLGASRPNVVRYIKDDIRPKAEWVKGLIEGSDGKLTWNRLRPDLC